MGNGRLRHTQHLSDITHAHLRFKQQIQNFDARGVPKYFEQFCKIEQDLVIRHLFLHFGYNVLVYMHIFAAFVLAQFHKKHILSYEHPFN